MPKCKNCGARIEKFNKDLCPVCGFKHPLEDVESDTIEITSEISNLPDYINVVKSKKTAMLLFSLLGFTGAPFFYLKFNKKAVVYMLIHLAFIGLFGLLLFKTTKLEVLGFLVSFLISIFSSIIFGAIYLFTRSSIKDGNGDFIK